MAKKANETQNKDASPVVQQLYLSSVSYNRRDVGDLRTAIHAATSVHFPNEVQLFDLFEELLTFDSVLSGIIRKRISQVINKKLLFLKDGKEVPEMSRIIKSKVFKDIMRQIIASKIWGVSGLEFLPGEKLAFKPIPRKHIKRKTQIISFRQNSLTDGISYTGVPNLWIIGDDGDLGLLLICAFIALLKKGAISDWAQYIEVFGSPAIILKYKGFNPQARKQAETILKNIGNSMRIAVPEEMDIKFEDGKIANGDGKLHDAFRQACNEEYSIAILGNTETTGHSKTGTGAKSETHANQQMELIKDDMDDLCDLLNSDHFMNILRSYNLPVDGGEFEFDREVDIKALAEKQKIDLAFIQAGLKVPASYVYENYAIPMPKDNEDILELSSSATADQSPAPVAKPRSGKKSVPAGKGSMDEISAMLDEKLKAFFG